MNIKRILVVLLTLTMLTSAFAPTLGVFATELQNVDETPEKETINYVSLGDSMTNGFGMDDYGTSGRQGYLEANPGAYPAKFAAWLAGIDANDVGFQIGESIKYEGDDVIVNLTQLATSGNRAEDIYYMLNQYGKEDAPEPDAWLTAHLLNGNWDGINDEVAQLHRDSVANADIITYSGGNGNYGNFFVWRVLPIVGMGTAEDLAEDRENYAHMTYENAIELIQTEFEFDQDTIDLLNDTYANAKTYLEENGLPMDMVLEIADYLTYITASYIVTYDKTIDYLAAVNPDVELVILPFINNGVDFDFDITLNGITKSFNAGDFLGMIYEPLDAYMAVYTAIKQAKGECANIKFYYAELPTDENGETIQVETFAAVNAEFYVPVPENATIGDYPYARWLSHDRFIDDIRGFIFPILTGGSEGVYFDADDVRDYEIAKANGYDSLATYIYQNSDKAQWITQYLGVIDAVMSALSGTPNIDIDALGMDDFSDINLMDMVMPSIDGIDVEIQANALLRVEKEMKDAIYDVIYRDAVDANVVPMLQQMGAFSTYESTLDQCFGLDADASDLDKTIRLIEIARQEGDPHPGFAVTDQLIADSQQVLMGAHDQIVSDELFIMGTTMLPVLPYIPEAMEEELCGIGIVNALLSVYGRMRLANGLSSHPSLKGHDTLKASIVNAYENNYTTVDETVENIKVLLDYLEENPNLVYSYAYDKVVEEGYIDIAVKALDETLAIIDLAADNVGLLGLTPELEAEVLVEINAAIATLDDLRAALVDGDASTIEGLMALVDKLEADLDTHIANVKAILAQAGYDVENVLVPTLLDAKARFEDEVVPVLFDMAEEFAWVAVDFLLTNIDEIYYNLPEIANTVYAKALEVAIMVQILVGDTVDYVVETAYDVYFLVYNTVLEYYDDVEAAIAEADRIVHELYTTLVTIDNRLGNPSKDFLDGKTIEEWANLFNELYHKVEGDVEAALAQLDVIIADLLVVADGEYAKALVVFNAILKGIGSGYDAAEDAVVVAGQIFSYVYDFVVEDLTLAELKATCDGLVDTIALTYENTKSVDAVGIAIYDYVLGLFDDTFTGDYQLTVDSLYVALGNATYGEELAELLHLGDKYHNFGLSDDYLDTLADADFVTVRLDNGEALSFAIEQFMSYDSTELDWSKHLDAEGQAALDRVLTSIETELRSTGAADQLAAALNSLADEYADGVINVDGEFVAIAVPHILETSIYAYADAIDRLETVIANVNTLAPNATVVITGVQNPLDALDLSAFGLDIGEYAGALDYVVDIFNVQLVAIAYANDNIIYVDSVDAADIYAALNVTCAHAYDDCEDTTCNICGETRVAPGHTYGDYVSNGDAKCGVDGTKTRTCSACGKKDTVADTGSALEHDWTDWEVVKEPTSNKEGLKQRTCKLCGEIQTEAIPPKGNGWVWIVVGSVVVLAAAAGVVFYRKKKAVPATEENKK